MIRRYFSKSSLSKKLWGFAIAYVSFLISFPCISLYFWRQSLFFQKEKDTENQLSRLLQTIKFQEKSFSLSGEVSQWELLQETKNAFESFIKKSGHSLFKNELYEIETVYYQYEHCLESFATFSFQWKQNLALLYNAFDQIILLLKGFQGNRVTEENEGSFNALVQKNLQYLLELEKLLYLNSEESFFAKAQLSLSQVREDLIKMKEGKSLQSKKLLALQQVYQLCYECDDLLSKLKLVFFAKAEVVKNLEVHWRDLDQRVQFLLAKGSQVYERQEHRNLFVFILISFGIVVCAFVLVLILNRLLHVTLGSITQVSKNLSEGDLTSRLGIHSEDEIGDMSKSFNAFIQAFQAIILQINNSIEHTTEAADQLANTASLMNKNAAEVKEQSQNVALSGEIFSTNIIFMASMAEEISASVMNISQAIKNIYAYLEMVLKTSQVNRGQLDQLSFKNQTSLAFFDSLDQIRVEKNLIVEQMQLGWEKCRLALLNAKMQNPEVAGKKNAFEELEQFHETIKQELDQFFDHFSIWEQDSAGIKLVLEEIDKILIQAQESFLGLEGEVTRWKQDTNEISKTADSASIAINDLATNIHDSAESATNVSVSIQDISKLAEFSADAAQEIDSRSQALIKIATQLKATIYRFKV